MADDFWTTYRVRRVQSNLDRYNERQGRIERGRELRWNDANVKAFKEKVRSEALEPLEGQVAELDSSIRELAAQRDAMNKALGQIHIPLKAQGMSDGDILDQALEQSRKIAEIDRQLKELRRTRGKLKRQIRTINGSSWMEEQMKNYNPNEDYGADAVLQKKAEDNARRAGNIIDFVTNATENITGALNGTTSLGNTRASSSSPTSGASQSGPAQAGTAQANTAQAGAAQADNTQANTAQAGTVQADNTQANTAQAGTVQADNTQANTAQAGEEQAQEGESVQDANAQAQIQAQAGAGASQAQPQPASAQAGAGQQGSVQETAAQAQAPSKPGANRSDLENHIAALECIKGKYANQDNEARRNNLANDDFDYDIVQPIVNHFYDKAGGNNPNEAARLLEAEIERLKAEGAQAQQQEQPQQPQQAGGQRQAQGGPRSGWVKINGEWVFLRGEKYEAWLRQMQNEKPSYMQSLGDAFGAYFGNFLGGGIDPSGVSTSERAQADISERMAADRQKAAQANMQAANRNYIDEANKLAAAQAAQKNAQVVSNLGNASAGAAALARGTEEADYRAQQARADEQRAQGVQNLAKAGELRGTAEQARLEAKKRDWQARDLARENAERQRLAMARRMAPNGVPDNDETEPEDDQPEDTKPEDTKPEDTKPEDTKPEDTKHEDTKHEGNQTQTEPVQAETSPDETQSTIVEALIREPGAAPPEKEQEEEPNDFKALYPEIGRSGNSITSPLYYRVSDRAGNPDELTLYRRRGGKYERLDDVWAVRTPNGYMYRYARHGDKRSPQAEQRPPITRNLSNDMSFYSVPNGKGGSNTYYFEKGDTTDIMKRDFYIIDRGPNISGSSERRFSPIDLSDEQRRRIRDHVFKSARDAINNERR